MTAIRPPHFLLILTLTTAVAHAQDPATRRPLSTYEGDGLRILVFELSEERGTVSGEIHRGATVHPFQGRMVEESGVELVRGTFATASQPTPFTAQLEETTQNLLFSTGSQTLRLRSVAPPAPPPLPAPVPRPDAPPPHASTGTLRLKQHVFRDINMGNAVAYTALLPEGWTSKGHVEWSPAPVSFPQQKFELRSPEGARLLHVPLLTFNYVESKPVGGFAPLPPQGVPAPQNLGAWIVSAVQQSNPASSNFVLVDSRRDAAAEEAAAKLAREMGSPDNGIRRECHLVTFDFDEAGIRNREIMSVHYLRFPPLDNPNLRSQMWSLSTTYVLVAPADRFDALKPQLQAAAASIRPDGRWWVRQQEAIGQMSRARSEEWATVIARNGARISKLSDDEHARFRKHLASMDGGQKTRIDAIYERSDYRDTNGDAVNLPMHYKHVFSDGGGNYLLSDRPLTGPTSNWTEITPVK